MTGKESINRIISVIRQQKDDLCIEVRRDSNIIIIHLANGEQEAIKLPSDKLQMIYELLTISGIRIQKPETIE